MAHDKSWFLKDIILPFFLTRFFLLISGHLSSLLLPFNPTQNETVRALGYVFSPKRFIDIWARWDSGWYLSIINSGYKFEGDLYGVSNLPFLPVYPLLVKFFAVTLLGGIGFPVTNELIITTGVVLSNIMFILGLSLVYQIAQILFKNKYVAQVSVWTLLVFPTSFFFSSFYTESSFLFFATLAYYAALTKKWWLASIAASFAGATRIVGIFIALPIIFEYLKSKNFSWKKIDFSIMWFLIIPVGIIAYFIFVYSLTGDFFAAFRAQAAWGRSTTNPITSLLFPSGFWIHMTPLDQFFVISTLLLSLQLLKEKLESLKVLGVYSILMIVPNLFTGTLDSLTRYLIVIFPVFIYWAHLVRKNKKFTIFILVISFIFQLIYFGLFSQSYWAG